MTFSLWNIPDIAWKRKLGDYPKGSTGTHPPLEVDNEISIRTKRGIPVGGIGTGSFMFNLAGSFGPWEFGWGDDSSDAQWGSEAASGHEERYLQGGAFHVYQESGSKKNIKTLATEDVFKSWPTLEKSQGTYYALFPKAWVEYDMGLCLISLKQFSPFIPRNDKLSSLPIGFFQFKIRNTTFEIVTTSIMFTFPNAIYRKDTKDYSYTRKGLSSHYITKEDVIGVRLQAEHPDNVPVTQQSEWVIATRYSQNTSKEVSWADWALDDSAKIIELFSETGKLPNGQISTTRGEAGAVAVKIVLKPGEEEIISFALSWDFPIVQFKNPIEGTKWWKRYKEWYPGYFRGFDIAFDGLRSIEEWETKVDEWMRLIIDNPKYPHWLKQGALNELYFDIFCSFWENGCISKPKKFGNRPNQHLFFNLESAVYRDCETLDIRHYEAIHKKIMFPNIERDTLLLWADFVLHDSKGRTTHDEGSPVNDPFFEYGQYYMTSRNLHRTRVNWKDLPSMFVQQAYAYYLYTKDLEFLKEIYPAVKRALFHLVTCDKDDDGLPEHHGIDTSYDGLGFRGTSTYISGLFIGALEALISMSRILGFDEEEHYLQSLNRKARDRLEALLWMDLGEEEGGYYKAAEKKQFAECLMTDALNGQRYADVCGLPDVFPLDHRVKHYECVCKFNWKKQAGGKYGTVNIVGPNGESIPNSMARGIWPGGAYFTAATMYRTGKEANRPDLMEYALKIAESVYNTTFLDEEMAFWFNTPAIWWPEPFSLFRSQQNMRIRAIWELLFEVDNPFPDLKMNDKKSDNEKISLIN